MYICYIALIVNSLNSIDMKTNPNIRFPQTNFLLLFLLALMIACTAEDEIVDANSKGVSTNVGFDYSTNSQVDVRLQLKNLSGNASSGMVVRLFLENPYVDDMSRLKPDLTPNVKGVSDFSGRFSVRMTVPTYIKTIYAIVDGYNTPLTFELKGSVIDETLYPSGFGVKRLQTRAYPTGYNPKIFANPANNSYANGCWVLGDYETGTDKGLPNFLDGTETIPQSLLDEINITLAETPQNIPNNYPQLIDEANKANLIVTDNANIWVTFIKEGAGYRNTVGYFYYKTADGPPANVPSIFKRMIFFPNSSASGSGGQLTTGTRVKLLYCDPNNDPNVAANWTDVFPAGTTVCWFVISSGYNSNSITNGAQYSIYSFNAGSRPQTVLLYDPTNEKIVLGFEDISRMNSSDADYNDCVFCVTANPITAIDRSNLDKINQKNTDTDGDGVTDVNDEYPNDPARAFNNYYPGASSFGSLAFEDNWPAKGDYDFNDLVVDYRITYVTNAAGNVKDVIFTSQVKAIGASNLNGFAWQLDAAPANVESVTTTYIGPGTLLGGSLFTLHAKGYETGQSKLVIPFFDNAFTLFGSSYIPNFPNTVIGGAYYNPTSITKKVTFTSAVQLSSLGSLPFNPFLVVAQNRGREIHKVNHAATDKANSSYFNTQDDVTNQSNKWYIGSNGAPWVIETAVQLEYPIAGAPIETAFLKFNNWVNSAGVTNPDWYNNNAVDYRSTSKIYRRN